MFRIFLIFINCVASLPCLSQNLYSASGTASYYANIFDGRKTACGEIFSNKKMTAAHPTLPFGTLVKVTNSKNNKTVVVRINDRGPYAKSRIIDLSRAAADSLGMIHSGWARVKIEEIQPAVLEVETPVVLADAGIFRFPEDWLGKWNGMLNIYNSRGLEKQIPMQLEIIVTDSPNRYQWTIIYDSIPRNYELVLRDSAKSSYSLNEHNGIDIASSVTGNRLISRFSLSGNLIKSEYHLISYDEMIFEISTGNDSRSWTTGNVVSENHDIPEVHVFDVSQVQYARLERVNK
jgi:rare lipoprotein A